MGLSNLLKRLKSGVSDTPDTPEQSAGYQSKPSTGAGCTPDTPDTSLIDRAREIAANDGGEPWQVAVSPGTSPAAMVRLRAASLALERLQAANTGGICKVPTGQVASEVSTEADGFSAARKCEVRSQVRTESGIFRAPTKPEMVDLPVNADQVRSVVSAETDDEWWSYATAMTGPEIDTFTARLDRFVDQGLSLDDSERLADRLAVRDREADDRRVCLECQHVHGAAGHWRCGNWQAAGIAVCARDTRLPAALVSQLQRCDGFKTHFTPTPESLDHEHS